MDVSLVIAGIGAAISVHGVHRYVCGILRGNAQPRMASWTAWLTANSVFTLVAFSQGALLAVAINLASVATNVAVIAASIKRGVGAKPGDAIDWSCLAASVACVGAVVMVPDNNLLGAMLAVIANVIATIPTFRHAWSKPHEEVWQLFAANVLAGGLGAGGVAMASGPVFASMAGPLITMLANSVLVAMTVGRVYVSRIVETAIVADIHLAEETLAPERFAARVTRQLTAVAGRRLRPARPTR